jgi:aminoglycoside 6'-N-acetyltransferase
MAQGGDPPTLCGQRVTLRPLTEADRELLNPVIARPGVREWWGMDLSLDPEQDAFAFAIVAEGEVAGWLAFYEEEDPDYRHGGLDIFLAPEFQNRGLGREALYLAAEWMFEARGHHRLVIDPMAMNTRAIAVYASIGFKRIGIMRRYQRDVDGKWRDGLLMDMLPEELTKPS